MALFVAFVIFFVMLTAFFYKAYQNTHQVVINHIQVGRPHHPKKSRPFTPMNVLHISDMHLEKISIQPEQIYQQFKNTTIDLIALTGDFLDRKRSIPKLIPYLEVFQRLNPNIGTYAVFGNHDYLLKSEDLLNLKQLLESYRCKVLQNDNDIVDLDHVTLNIIGIDDFSTRRSDLSAAYRGVTHGYKLVLTHDPNVVLTMDEYDFDYLVSGHFHGGQIHWPKPYHLVKMGKLCRMNMVQGLHTYQGKCFYISEGLGQTGLNIRVGSRPEMTLHQLHLPVQHSKHGRALAAI